MVWRLRPIEKRAGFRAWEMRNTDILGSEQNVLFVIRI
jgi:hypothetical protein